MPPPLIGVTTYAANEKGEYNLPREYSDAVRRAGGLPVLLPPGEAEAAVLARSLHGFIISGGGDLDPALYSGAVDHPEVYGVDRELDDFHMALIPTVIEAGRPLLAICRGSQVLNVALGGTLVEHIPDRYGEQVKHRTAPRDPTPHELEVDTESRLCGLLGAPRFSASSWHHQSIRDVGEGLRAVAYADDGVIEAVESDNDCWLYGLQWHPEITAADDPIQQRIFDELVRAATALWGSES